MTSLYLRRAKAPERTLGPLTPNQIIEAVPSGEDCIALSTEEPFAPIDRELDRNGNLRDVLLEAFPLAKALRYSQIRFALFAGLVPMFLLVVLDAELLCAARPGAGAALLVDLLCCVWVAIDLARKHARLPYITAAALGATSLRFAQIVATGCAEGVHPVIPLLGVVALACAIATLALAPSPRSMADHLRSVLALAPPTRLPPRTSRGFFRYIVYAVLAAASLPFLLWLLRSTPLGLQLLIFILFALVVPYVGHAFIGEEFRPSRPSVSGLKHLFRAQLRMNLAFLWHRNAKVMAVVLSSLILSFALVRGAHDAVETVAIVQSCTSSQGAIPSLQRFVDGQRLAVSHAKKGRGPAWLLLTVLVVPVAEELVYRGLVHHALRRRLRRRLAIGLSALLFGLAHIVVYHGAVYQPVLLGLSFGLAYERGGILASILVHMLWNLWLSI